MRIRLSVNIFYTLFCLCLATSSSVWANWEDWVGQPPLEGKYREHQFLAACREGRLDIVRHWLSQPGFDPSQWFPNGSIKGERIFGLFLAVQNGHTDVVKELVEKGADVNQSCDDGSTPLYVASLNGHTDVVKELVEKGADVNQSCDDGSTPLYVASQDGHPDVVQVLVENGAEPNTTWEGATPLFIASQKGHTDVVQVLVKNGAELNTAWEGATPLFIASKKGHTDVVQVLVGYGADVNQSVSDGATPLLMASQNGHDKVVEILIENGADPTKKWRHWKVFHRSPLDSAKNQQRFVRRSDTEKRDRYAGIVTMLRKAEHDWKHVRLSIERYPSETTSLLSPAMSRLSLSGKP